MGMPSIATRQREVLRIVTYICALCRDEWCWSHACIYSSMQSMSQCTANKGHALPTAKVFLPTAPCPCLHLHFPRPPAVSCRV